MVNLNYFELKNNKQAIPTPSNNKNSVHNLFQTPLKSTDLRDFKANDQNTLCNQKVYCYSTYVKVNKQEITTTNN